MVGPSWFLQRALLASLLSSLICSGFAYAAPPPDEFEVIKSTKGIVQRVGAELKLKLLMPNDKEVVFRNEDQCGNDGKPKDWWHCVTYTLTAYLPERRAIVILEHRDESSNFIWASCASGFWTRIASEPHYSPNGGRIIALDSDVDEGYNGIQIWNVLGNFDSLQLEWEYKPRRYELYDYAKWTSDTTVSLKETTYIDDKIVELPVQLIFGTPKLPGWHLELADQAPKR